MKNPFYILLFSLSCIAFINTDCKKNPVAPVDITHGRRDYTWYVDTVFAGGNAINGIDGVLSNDVWLITNAGDFSQTFFHFDGTKWTTDGVNRTIAPNAVRAYATNDVWSVGLQGDIWLYNDTWSKYIKIPSPGTNYYDLEDIDGNSWNNQYAVGNLSFNGDDLYPLMYHYDGNTWTRVTVSTITDCDFYKIRFYALNHALILGSTHKPDSSVPDSCKIYKFDGTNVQEIYSATEGQSELGNFTNCLEGIIILRGMHLTLFDGSSEQDILTVQNSLFVNNIAARTTKDIFLGMSDGIAHYNGTDIQYLFKYYQGFHGAAIIKVFSNSVFIATNDWNTNLNVIYRGYLK